jgi:amino acid adenylation domain-containing protein
MTMLVQDFLHHSAHRFPDKVALVCAGTRLTYAQLENAANQLARSLQNLGVARGDRVAILLPNSVEAVVGIFAVLKAGGVFLVVNRVTKPDKLMFILNNCRATALITDARAIDQGVGETLLEKVPSLGHFLVSGKAHGSFAAHPRCHPFAAHAEAPRSTPPASRTIDLDLACLIYTSGTTGEAKGVMCDHSNIVFVTQSIVESLRNTSGDIVLCVLPLAFSYGLYQLMASVCTGGTLVLEESFAFPAAVMQKLAQERVTGFAGVPTIYSIILGMDLRGYELSRLRYLTNAAAGLPVEHVKRLRQLFPSVELYLMHGLTEVARTMRLPPDQVDLRPDSSGLAIPGTELWIEDETGRRLAPGEVGELIVRGRHVMRGYWDDPEQTAKRFRPGPLPGERICYSGDLFRTDENGFFYFVSRKDDVFKCRGEKVAPREVENVIYSMPGVQEAAVVGIPDPLLGRAVKAFVVASASGLTEAAVIAHCKARLEDFMVPQQVEFRRELPKTDNGKIRKLDLH